jgi:hypothetical protein
MKLRDVLVAPLMALAVAACGGGGEDYPAEVAEPFLSSCTAGGTSEAVCQCALDKLEEEYSLEEFTEESTAFAQGSASEEFSQDIVQFSLQCQQEEG